MDYGMPERRKTRGDKRAKARFNKYKRGGAFRARLLEAREKVNKY